ncbi:MAG: hypothetical protein KOO60_10760 [Gemmatimonadales bacterium]|nr:hypothetical protein [Gemmatimonadales bacterium]
MTAKKPAKPKVYVNGVPFPLPHTLPIFGHDYLVVVLPNDSIFDEKGPLFAEINHDSMELRLQRDWTSVASFLSTIIHEGSEGAKDHCDLHISHERLSTLAECLGPFLAALIMAQ